MRAAHRADGRMAGKGSSQHARSRLLLTRRVATCLAVAVLACQTGPSFNGEVVKPLLPAPELSGLNWDGESYRLRDDRGRVAVVFFGYTFCPDVCPFTLSRMKQLYQALGERAAEVSVVFVSVDPERDTHQKLAQYIPAFDQRFRGLRLEGDDLRETLLSFGVTVQLGPRRETPGSSPHYYVDHTGTLFVVDREGRLRLEFPPDATAEEMLPDIETLLAG